jgi:hypothetical protein
LRSKWAVGKARGGRVSESIRNRRATQPPAHFHRNPMGRGQLAVFPRCSLLTYRFRYARRSRLEKQPTDLRRKTCYFGDRTLTWPAAPKQQNVSFSTSLCSLRSEPHIRDNGLRSRARILSLILAARDGPLVPFTIKPQWAKDAGMHPDSNFHLQGTPWPCELSESDKERLITKCEAKWKRLRVLVTILEAALWVSAIVVWVGITYLCRLNP